MFKSRLLGEQALGRGCLPPCSSIARCDVVLLHLSRAVYPSKAKFRQQAPPREKRNLLAATAYCRRGGCGGGRGSVWVAARCDFLIRGSCLGFAFRIYWVEVCLHLARVSTAIVDSRPTCSKRVHMTSRDR